MKTIFVATSNDPDSPLDLLSKEYDLIYEYYLSSTIRNTHYFHREERTTADSLSSNIHKFKDEIEIFHFAGHADEDTLNLSDNAFANANGVADLLGQCKNLKLVVLNGCSTHGQVQRLIENDIPIIIATSSIVHDKRALQFSKRFYYELFSGTGNIKEALKSAESAVRINDESIKSNMMPRGISLDEFEEQKDEWKIYFREDLENTWKDITFEKSDYEVIQSTKNNLTIRDNKGTPFQIEKNRNEFVLFLDNNNVQYFRIKSKVYDKRELKDDYRFNSLMRSVGVITIQPSRYGIPENQGIKNLIQGLGLYISKTGVEYSDEPTEIISFFGGMLENFLTKLLSEEGKDDPIYQLSLITETFQISLKYLSFIQMVDFIKNSEPEDIKGTAIDDFIHLRVEEHNQFDFLNLLIVVTKMLERQVEKEKRFVPEIVTLVNQLEKDNNPIFKAALFLQEKRNFVFKGIIPEDEYPHPKILVDMCMQILIRWLRQLVFLARYKLISMKDIRLDYRLNSVVNFKFTWGELHGLYYNYSKKQDFEDSYTYSQSVLLTKKNKEEKLVEGEISSLKNFLPLSPFIIDKSVYMEGNTNSGFDNNSKTMKQCPNLMYYLGMKFPNMELENNNADIEYSKGDFEYVFSELENELQYDVSKINNISNKKLNVSEDNPSSYLLNNLYTDIFKLTNKVEDDF